MGNHYISRRRFMGVAAGGLLAAFGLGACSSNGQGSSEQEKKSSVEQYSEQEATVFVFDTVVTLKAHCSEETMNSLVDRCNYFENKFSRTIEESDIGRINAAGGEPVEVCEETADIITKALDYCAASEGQFDITIGAASTLWDFNEGVVPDPGELAEAIKHIDYTKVQVEGTTVQLLDPAAKLDLGGIAKGYIADDLAQMLADAGCDCGCINLGGNVKTVGLNGDGVPWKVGIQDPNNVDGDVVAKVESEGTSVVTSGLYERKFTKDGKTYWHILDPKTGYPVKTDIISATIVSDASIDGDGFTKPLFMLSKKKAMSFLAERPQLQGYLITKEGKVLKTDNCSVETL